MKITRIFDNETYISMGCPNLRSVIFIKKGINKVYGTITALKYFSGKNNFQITIDSFKHKK